MYDGYITEKIRRRATNTSYRRHPALQAGSYFQGWEQNINEGEGIGYRIISATSGIPFQYLSISVAQ
jgi:hypothetical protein